MSILKYFKKAVPTDSHMQHWNCWWWRRGD